MSLCDAWEGNLPKLLPLYWVLVMFPVMFQPGSNPGENVFWWRAKLSLPFLTQMGLG